MTDVQKFADEVAKMLEADADRTAPPGKKRVHSADLNTAHILRARAEMIRAHARLWVKEAT